jgi:hypothetical protein
MRSAASPSSQRPARRRPRPRSRPQQRSASELGVWTADERCTCAVQGCACLGSSPSSVLPSITTHRPLLEALSAEPLLQLGLSGPQYRTLATLREAAVMLTPELDALKYDRWVLWLLMGVVRQEGAW